MKPRKTSQRIIGMVVGVFTGILAFVFVNEMLYPKPMNVESDVDYHSKLKQMAVEMNKVAQGRVNNNMRFDSVSVISSNIFQYYYTVLDVSKDSINVTKFEYQYQPTLINNIKAEKSLELLRKQKVNVNYCYYDKNGVLFSKISITPEMYK